MINVIQKTPIDELVNYDPDLAPLKCEDHLNLQGLYLEDLDAEKGISLAPQCVKIGANSIEKEIDTIDFTSFKFLFMEILKDCPTSIEYVTALKLHYGLKERKMTLIYQPIWLIRTEFDPSSQMSKYTINETEKFYSLNDTTFETENNYNSIITDYQYFIKIKKTLDGEHIMFEEGCTESCIITFQTIFTLFYNLDYKSISLYNAIRTIPYDTRSIRHSIIIGRKIEEFKSIKPNFYNRSHLCPPCSTTVAFDLSKSHELTLNCQASS